MVKSNQHIIGEQFIRHDGVQRVSDKDKKIAWKSYHEKLLNKALAWDGNSLSQADTVGDAHPLLDKYMIRESINKMKNGKATELSSVVLEMVTAV